MNQINQSFGSGGMTTAFESNTLIEFVQYLQRSHEGAMPIKKGVLVPGLQEEGICVLNESTFINAEGELIDAAECNLVWLSRDIVHESSKVRSKDITPKILCPLSLEPLEHLYHLCVKMAKHNLIPTLLMIAAGIQSFHYHTIIDAYGCCPIAVAIGEPETGKSTALTAALSLFGCQEIGVSVKSSNAILLERACSTGIPFAIEEGKGNQARAKTNQLDIAELIVDVSNGSRSANMKTGTMKPETVPLISSNFNLEEMARYVLLT